MEKFKRRKRVCQICAGKTIDYKDVSAIEKYISENGKILPRRITGTCARHQRLVAQEVKRARFMALVKYTG